MNSTPKNALIFAHAAGYSSPARLTQKNRFLLTSVEPESELHFQRFRPFDEATLETDSPIIMEIGRTATRADEGLLSALVRLTRSISSGPLARLRKSSPPRLLRRELQRAFRLLGRDLANTRQPDVSMALVDQKRVGLASTGNGVLLKLGREGAEEITPASGQIFAVSENELADACPVVSEIGSHDRLVLASRGLADSLEPRDFEKPNIRLASPARLSRRLLKLAKKRGLESASVVTACFAERVPVTVVEPKMTANETTVSIPLPSPMPQPAIAV